MNHLNMTVHRLIGLPLLAMAMFLTLGCASSQAVKDAPNPLEIDVTEYDRMFDASIAVFREQHLGVQVKDYRMGTVVSKPAVSPTLIEAWRIENAVEGSKLQSTLNKQRRVITVSFRPAPGEPEDNPQTYHMGIQVVIEQEQNPRIQMTGSTSGHSILASYSQTPGELADRGISGQYWYPVGTDPLLENKLMRTIVHRSLTIGMQSMDTEVDEAIDQTQAPRLDGLDKQ
ncbi:MAG: hypothetical protein CMJ19_01915 [Phycisphaeraceae bacterium]|nr:hypothetical protein [Phycisphaeraceae bacterium]